MEDSPVKYFNCVQVFLFLLLISAGCGQSQRDSWYEKAVRYYLQTNYPDMRSYKPARFELIDQDFLMRKPEVALCMQNLRRLFSLKQEILAAKVFLYGEKNMVSEGERLPPFRLDTLNRYIFFYAGAGRKLTDEATKQEYRRLANETEKEIAVLNDALAAYNLSVYNLDFEKMDSVFVYHKYAAIFPPGQEQVREAIFEMDKNTYETLSELEIKP